MTPLVTIMSSIIAGMKPTINAVGVVASSTTTFSLGGLTPSITKWLYVGTKLKLTFADGIVYGTVTWVISTQIDFSIPVAKSTKPTAISVVLNYHHGHPAEIVNLFRQATHDQDVKFEQFPAICLFQDIPEKHSVKGKDREARLNMVIITDTDSKY